MQIHACDSHWPFATLALVPKFPRPPWSVTAAPEEGDYLFTYLRCSPEAPSKVNFIYAVQSTLKSGHHKYASSLVENLVSVNPVNALSCVNTCVNIYM